MKPTRPFRTKALCALLSAALAGMAGSAGAAPASGWTSGATRAYTVKPNVPITSNASATWSDYDPPALYPKAVTLPMQQITMADGAKLAAFVTLPADADGKPIPGPLPTVLNISDYDIALDMALIAPLQALLPALDWLPAQLGAYDPYMVSHGYASVSVDGRGTGNSQGTWTAWGPDHMQDDSQRILDWASTQPWSNGKLGLYGVSDTAINTMFAASTGHPAVRALFSVVPMGDAYRDIAGTGGQTNLFFFSFWLTAQTVVSALNPQVLVNPAQALPLVISHLYDALATFQLPTFLQALQGSPTITYDGDFWSGRSPIERVDRIKVPTFIYGSAHDLFQRGEPLLYERLKQQVPAKLLLGSQAHAQTAISLGVTGDGVPLVNHNELRWFDQYVKGLDVGADKLPNVTQNVLGYNHLVPAVDWPHPQARAQRYYLHGDASLSTSAPTASILSWNAPRRLWQQPLGGLCSISASQWSLGVLGFIPLPCFNDDNFTELLNVVYQTPPLAQDMYVNGPIQADLWVATTNNVATVSVRVDDVDFFGHATPLTNGLLDARYRAVDPSRSRTLDGQSIQPWHPFTEASLQPVTPGQVMKLPIEIFPTAALIKAGHRLRVAVGPSNLPQGVPTGDQLIQNQFGTMTVYNDPDHPSSVLLPLVPASVLH